MNKYGFNFQWMFTWEEGRKPEPPDEKALDFLAELGFNFVRITTDYRYWTKNFEYLKPDMEVFSYIDSYLKACKERNLHLCLNFHRVPGYCINYNYLERDNLWTDRIAQEGFIYQWKLMAERYKGVDNKDLSFDLINEPPEVGQYGLTRENHADLIRRTVQAIRTIDPNREIVIDGLGGGHLAIQELADLDVIQSGRGYQPMSVSHYQATWWDGHKGLPEPVYPNNHWDGKVWNKESLREFYQPWRDLQAKGVKVHIGEFGCYNKTPNDAALRWLGDMMSLYKEFGWGYSLWNFEGEFGIIGHGRPGAVYELYKGYRVDRKLLDILLENRL
ncbi:MAG: glycoside hydrolase family 5 protein [Clostridia bacterium]|nr:glycoside hydrolase family 5 protein [Clostridia bacterium]